MPGLLWTGSHDRERLSKATELALRYGKPVIVYALDERLVRAFPSGAPRAATIQEVEDFLRLQLA